MRQQGIIISKDVAKGMVAKANLSAGKNIDMIICRTVEEALQYARYYKVHAMFIDDKDLMAKYVLERDFGGGIETYNISFPWNPPVTRADRFNQWVSTAIQSSGLYWQRYGIRKLPRLILQFLVLGVLRVINTFKPVEIVHLLAHRLGHLCYNTQIYMEMREKAKRKPMVIALAFIPANDQLMKMWNRNFLFAIHKQWWIEFFNSMVFQRSGLWTTAEWYRDIDEPMWKWDTGKVFLGFTEKEEREGMRLYNEMLPRQVKPMAGIKGFIATSSGV
jgi:hypothetical protein